MAHLPVSRQLYSLLFTINAITYFFHSVFHFQAIRPFLPVHVIHGMSILEVAVKPVGNKAAQWADEVRIDWIVSVSLACSSHLVFVYVVSVGLLHMPVNSLGFARTLINWATTGHAERN